MKHPDLLTIKHGYEEHSQTWFAYSNYIGHEMGFASSKVSLEDALASLAKKLSEKIAMIQDALYAEER